jgi:LysM repeat protein
MRRSARSGQGSRPRLVLVREGHPHAWSGKRATRSAVPSQRRSADPGAAPLRLTRRGRVVVRVGGSLLILLALLAGVLLLNRTAEAGSQARPVPAAYHVVMPGETLWQIAGEVAPGVDRRDTVASIVEVNALPSAAVSAGQRIAVPVRTP